MQKRTKKIIAILIFTLIVSFVFLRNFLNKDYIERLDYMETYYGDSELLEDKYSEYIKKHDNIDHNDNYLFDINDANLLNNASLYSLEETLDYGKDVVLVNRNDGIELNIAINTTGYYVIELDYFYLGTELFAPKYGILIDGKYPFYESRQMSVPIAYVSNQTEINGIYQKIQLFETDRYNNDIQPKSSIKRAWQSEGLFDASYYHQSPLEYYFEKGDHTLTIISRNDDVLLGDIKLKPNKTIKDYESYKNENSQYNRIEEPIILEAEYLKEKSDSSIKLVSDTESTSTPFDFKEKRLNAIDAYTWDEPGKSVTWEINVLKEGLYTISFKYIQYRLVNIAAFREIKINGEIPFEEFKNYPFMYTTKWKNETLGSENEPYLIYLNSGKNTITLTSSIEPYLPVIESIETIMTEITNLSIRIKQLTGGKTDTNRDWDLVSFIPEISNLLNGWAQTVEDAHRFSHTINKVDIAAAELVNLKIAASKLRELANRPNHLPNKLDELSEGSTSVSQYLGDMVLRFTKQSVGLEKIYLNNENDLPKARANFFLRTFSTISRFFISFQKQTTVKSDPDKTIEVWINRPRANIDLLQKMIDDTFTPQTGIHVNLTLMPNPSKLILAQAAGIEPDVALGVTSTTPYDFAIRNAAVDLREFSGYSDIVANFAKGSMMPYIYQDGVYGFPETQDFYLTFYRTDILGLIGASVPNTWDEVIALLPQLRRLGMNYYIPLGSDNSYKSFVSTAPFYEQFKARLYSEDGISTNIGSKEGIEAMTLMSQLFTIHDLPKQTASFYNHFRYGVLPIGVTGSSAYIQMLIAAPEIKGNWDIAPVPGVLNNGEILRYSAAPTRGTMIFKSSKKQQLAFDFLKWWLSDSTQIQFTSDIQTMFGKEYMWFSANLNAFKTLSISVEHKDIMLEQLKWAMEVPNVPGSYLLEREISNAWNKIVFNDVNIRSAVDEAVIKADREILRKMTEFGYVANGIKVKDYLVPTIDTIDLWLKEKDGNDNE